MNAQQQLHESVSGCFDETVRSIRKRLIREEERALLAIYRKGNATIAEISEKMEQGRAKTERQVLTLVARGYIIRSRVTPYRKGEQVYILTLSGKDVIAGRKKFFELDRETQI